MRAPRHWWAEADRPGWQARALAPAAALWRAGSWLRAAVARPAPAGVPVICIGNLTAGGAGKTPMVAAMLQRLAGQGIEAHVVSRGYGGATRGPFRVALDRHDIRDVGDEPLMLAALGTVWVSRDRAAAVRGAAAEGARLVLLDDGYQNPHVVKDRSILMVDAVQGFGNGRLIPAGPLREPLGEGLARADLVVLVGAAEARETALRRWPALAQKQVVGAKLRPPPTGLPLAGEPVVAFAGIGRPEKFFETLRELGAELVGAHGFPDHHRYRPAILKRLVAEARGAGAMLVTTEKDAVRLPADFRSEVVTVQVRLEPEDWTPIDALVRGVLPVS